SIFFQRSGVMRRAKGNYSELGSMRYSGGMDVQKRSVNERAGRAARKARSLTVAFLPVLKVVDPANPLSYHR
nr:hypothetical protein [Pyrinomonadaceae bacterium]